MNKIKIGTRGSRLALYQTNLVANELKKLGYTPEIVTIKTTGDQDYRPFKEISGDGFFTKELEQKILNGEIDIAVHSAKDLPSMVHSKLPWYAFDKRESTRDALIIKESNVNSNSPLSLKPNTQVATSSPRRRYQANKYLKNIQLLEMRGNVPTRIQKVIDGKVHSTILAEAGLSRLELLNNIPSDCKVIELNWTSAPCQGIIAVQGRVPQKLINKKLTQIAKAEKSVLAFLGSGCQMPVGCNIEYKNGYSIHVDLKWSGKTFLFEESSPTLAGLLNATFENLSESKVPNGQKIWITSPLQSQMKWAKILREAGYSPKFSPSIEIQPCFSKPNKDSILENLSLYDAFIFTSQFGVQISILELGEKLIEKIKSTPCYCVGKNTAKFLEKLNIQPQLPKSPNGLDTLSLAIRNGAKRPLFLGAENSNIDSELASHNVDKFVAYQTIENSDWIATNVMPEDTIFFTSPSAAKSWSNQHPESINNSILCIGSTTEKATRQLGFKNVSVFSPK